jgi:hypothetical protein
MSWAMRYRNCFSKQFRVQPESLGRSLGDSGVPHREKPAATILKVLLNAIG